MNIHHHRGCVDEIRKVKPWATIPWANIKGAIGVLSIAKTDDQILRMCTNDNWNGKDIPATCGKAKVTRGKKEVVPVDLSSDTRSDDNDDDFENNAPEPSREDVHATFDRSNESP